MKGLVYINHGRDICDCPYEGCTSALLVEPGDTSAVCAAPPSGCGRRYQIEWPPGLQELHEALANRPEQNRNWFPEGHPLATAVGWPTGQTPDDLREETRVFAPELGTVALSDEDAAIVGPILHKYGYALTRDLKHVKER